MKSAKIFIGLNAAIFCIYGLGFILFPSNLSLFVTDTIPSSTSGMIDMRATYGGISLGFGTLLVYCTRNTYTIPLGLWGVILIVGGMAFGRLIGIFFDGSPNRMMYIYLALEVVVVVWAFIIQFRTSNE